MIKKLFICFLFIHFLFQIKAQENYVFDKNQISVDFGSLRNRYLYPITNISYNSPVLKKFNVKFNGRLRSYGSLFFFSKSAYDLTPTVEYIFLRNTKHIHLSLGAGLDARLRFVNDIRSNAKSSAEPIITSVLYGIHNKFSYSIPIWSRFYSNGISFSSLPELKFKFSNRFLLLARYEISLLKIYKTKTHEWRRDCFIGASFLF